MAVPRPALTLRSKVKGQILTLTLRNLHSPGVRLHVDTTARFYSYYYIISIVVIFADGSFISVCLSAFSHDIFKKTMQIRLTNLT